MLGRGMCFSATVLKSSFDHTTKIWICGWRTLKYPHFSAPSSCLLSSCCCLPGACHSLSAGVLSCQSLLHPLLLFLRLRYLFLRPPLWPRSRKRLSKLLLLLLSQTRRMRVGCPQGSQRRLKIRLPYSKHSKVNFFDMLISSIWTDGLCESITTSQIPFLGLLKITQCIRLPLALTREILEPFWQAERRPLIIIAQLCVRYLLTHLTLNLLKMTLRSSRTFSKTGLLCM